MYVKKIHQFLSMTEKDTYKRKLVLFSASRCRMTVYVVCRRKMFFAFLILVTF